MTTDAPEQLLAQLCSDLRLLWTQAGGPRLRQLGERVGLGKSQVGAILNGHIREPPDWDVVRGLINGFADYAREHGRLSSLSLRIGIEEYWRPRYAVLEHAFSGPRRRHGAPVPPHPPGLDVPRQLPPPPRHFAGREPELAVLGELVERVGTRVMISAIAGTAGVGKTALAVHWAHQVAHRFPDGQLYVNLRGFDPLGMPMSPATAVRGFLDAFAVPPERLPTSADGQADLLRSLLAQRRVLIVLDNACDAEQVRALLPGSQQSMVLVTSRSHLSGLIAVEGAHPINVDLLTAADARCLLKHHLGDDRTATEPAAVDDIIVSCDRLPLALAIVAARAATHPSFPLGALATELTDARERLDAFDGGDMVRAAFSWSYRQLSTSAAQVFRFLGLDGGPDIAVPAVASLVGVPAAQARRALSELAATHLVEERAPGRFTFHDLLRTYAAELTQVHDTDVERRTAQRRLLDHYFHTAQAASALLSPHRDPIGSDRALAGVLPEVVTDAGQARDWFGVEYHVLLAAIRRATIIGLDAHAWRLTWTLADFAQRSGHWRDWWEIQRVALGAARRLGDGPAEAHTLRGLGRACSQLDQHADAVVYLTQAGETFRNLGDSNGEARINLDLVLVSDRRGRHAEGLSYARLALGLYLETGQVAGQARALNAVGWCHVQLGELEQALSNCQHALTIHGELGDPLGRAATLDSVGYVYHQLGREPAAIEHYREAITLFRNSGDRYGEADTLARLGDAHRAAGEFKRARTVWSRAADILGELGHAAAETVQNKISTLDSEQALADLTRAAAKQDQPQLAASEIDQHCPEK